MDKKPLYSFCHGWTVDERKGFNEVTCKRRESCAYYDVDFYRKHGQHLDDFDEMFPPEPCPYYVDRERPVAAKEEKADFFAFMKD